LAVFATGVVVSSQVPSRSDNELEPAVPYSVITSEFRISPDGTKTVTGELIRYVKANGEWRQVQYRHQNKDAAEPQAQIERESPVFASTDEGVFAKGSGLPYTKFVSQAADQQTQQLFRSRKSLRSAPTFVRTDEVAGLKVYVLRYEINVPGHPMEWIEKSFSPKTGYIPLRQIMHFRDGSEINSVATKVVFEDVPESLNDDLKALPKKGMPEEQNNEIKPPAAKKGN